MVCARPRRPSVIACEPLGMCSTDLAPAAWLDQALLGGVLLRRSKRGQSATASTTVSSAAGAAPSALGPSPARPAAPEALFPLSRATQAQHARLRLAPHGQGGAAREGRLGGRSAVGRQLIRKRDTPRPRGKIRRQRGQGSAIARHSAKTSPQKIVHLLQTEQETKLKLATRGPRRDAKRNTSLHCPLVRVVHAPTLPPFPSSTCSSSPSSHHCTSSAAP